MYLREVKLKRGGMNRWVLCVRCLTQWVMVMTGMSWTYLSVEFGPCDCCGKVVR